MVNDLTIPKDIVISDLTPGEIMLLKLVYDQNKQYFKHYFTTYSTYAPLALKSLENKFYLKINGDEFEDIILRKPALDLFKVNPIEKTIDEVIIYLNKKLNKTRGFSISSKSNRRFIGARLKDGYSLQDLIQVINTMYSKWHGTQWEEYLRPETIFNETKFQTYVNQVDINKDEEDWTIDKA